MNHFINTTVPFNVNTEEPSPSSTHIWVKITLNFLFKYFTKCVRKHNFVEVNKI